METRSDHEQDPPSNSVHQKPTSQDTPQDAASQAETQVACHTRLTDNTTMNTNDIFTLLLLSPMLVVCVGLIINLWRDRHNDTLFQDVSQPR
mgnify:CR=1 FL=1